MAQNFSKTDGQNRASNAFIVHFTLSCQPPMTHMHIHWDMFVYEMRIMIYEGILLFKKNNRIDITREL